MASTSTATVTYPQKRYYRQRAHSNPIADHCFDYPRRPDEYDWRKLYPDSEGKQVEFVDVGCGYGGLLITLGTMYPDILSLGMEIRVKVSDYVMDRIAALRQENPGQYTNVACLRSNAMKYLPNFFKKGQLSKMFFLFPDPHFKKKKHKWRIINRGLLPDYAYVLKENALVYTVTDVQDLHEWMVKTFNDCPLFDRLSEDEYKDDPVIEKLWDSSEEGKKVTRNKGNKYLAVYRRVKRE